MENNNLDKRFLKSKIAIKNAIETLYLAGKDISQMTVSEIATIAKISRKTFYLHYVDLNDFIIQTFNEGIDKVSKKFFDVNAPDFYQAIADFFIEITNLFQNNTLCKMVVSSEQYAPLIFDKLKQSIKTFMKTHPGAPTLDEYGQEFCSSGALFTYKYWMKKNKDHNYQYCVENINLFTNKFNEILSEKILKF